MRKLLIYALTTATTLTIAGTVPFASYAAPSSAYTRSGLTLAAAGSCGSSNMTGSMSGSASLNGLLGQLSGGQNGSGSGLTPNGITISNGTGIFNGSCLTFGGNGSCLGSGSCSGNGSCQLPGCPSDTGTQRPGGMNGNGQNNGATQDSYASQVVNLVNQERAKAGLAPLSLNDQASSAAMTRARELSSSFSHTRPSGQSFSTALTEAGLAFQGAGENIAYGQTSPEEVMNGWMNSAGHRANILSADFTEIGVAHYENGSGTDYWVQLFLK